MSMSILAVPVFAFMMFVTKGYGRDFVQAPAMENKRERLDCGGSRPTDRIPLSSPMTGPAALESIRRENKVPPIQWPLPRKHGKIT